MNLARHKLKIITLKNIYIIELDSKQENIRPSSAFVAIPKLILYMFNDHHSFTT